MSEEQAQRHFIRRMIDRDIAEGRWGPPGDSSVVRTRFPPEPNGSLHIGHAKSICLNFGLAEEYGGKCNLRFDDTNPTKEEERYVRSIVRDVRWLGFRWPGAREDDPLAGVLFASDYFQRLYEWALELIEKGLAYVDDQSAEEIREGRGTLTEAGRESAWRDRPAEESLDLFKRMAAGEFPDGSRVLRAKIDMASPNLNLRDPVMYRILRARHHRTGEAWKVYPTYDWAHGQEDAIEGITASLCTLEFEAHRPLYEWFLRAINRDRGPGSRWGERVHEPVQTEFSRLSLDYTLMSKRHLLELVHEGHVEGWDDPRMPTLSGLRRRGCTPEAIRNLCERVGVTKYNALTSCGWLEEAMRSDLNARAPRRMCVLRPLKVTITNWGEHGDPERVEWMKAQNNPECAEAGVRKVPFSRTLYIEREDFMEEAPKKFFRLKPGGEVRLRAAYWITCREVVKDETGEVVELRCTYDPQTRGGDSPPPDAEGKVRKVKGTLHWVSAAHAVKCEVRLFDRLFSAPQPGRESGDFRDDLNPGSLEVLTGCRLEPNWRTTEAERAAGTGAFEDGIERFQFERQGYFCIDRPEADRHSGPGARGGPGVQRRSSEGGAASAPVFNRTVTLKDSWARIAQK